MKKISLITPVYNGEETIEDCIQSISKQTFKDIEHIVIDGFSQDKTLEKIKNDDIKIISEADKGIYDAMNKGVLNSTGDVVGILNSDDLFYDKYVIEKVMHLFDLKDCDVVYGNIVCVDRADTNKVIRNYKTNHYSEKMFKEGSHPPHPAFFVKKEIYKKFGLFNIKYNIAADYEFMLRVLFKYKLKSVYIDEYLVKMRVGGVSNNSLKAIIKSNNECKQAWIDNGLKPPFGLVIKKPLSKIKQLIIK